MMCISCWVNIMQGLFRSIAKPENQALAARKPLQHEERQHIITPDAGIANLKLNDKLYSDESISENDTIEMHDCNADDENHDLNGSLNALKLKDNDSFAMNEFKNPNNIFGTGSLPSSMHTPPPSRSSSLLSLASHNSGSADFKLNSNFSTINFARPSTELPFQRYKANSTSGCWTRSPIYSRSVASTINHRLPRNNRTHLITGSELHKPLLYPARLPWLTKSNSNSSSPVHSENSVRVNQMNILSNAESEGDVSIFDSVSQAGDRNYPEMSDCDDEVPCIPDHNKNTSSLNSSPKSTISNITSVTMKSVAEVENSRVCKWILAACLLINLVLVILLILEVKEMREMEHWKSKVTL